MGDNPSPVPYRTYQSKRSSISSLASVQSAQPYPGTPIKVELPARSDTPPPNTFALSKPVAPSPLSKAIDPTTSALDRFPSPPLVPRPFSAQQFQERPPPSRPPSSQSQQRSKGKAPYRSGFQPQGVYRPRTEEFEHARNSQSESKRLERARIARRLDKLLLLHSDSSSQGAKHAGVADAIKANSVGDLWSSVRRSVQGSALRRLDDVKTAEQQIVRWQDDKSAKACPICTINFSITIRKHHCRLCGRVVCYVPPNTNAPPLGRTQRCSLFIISQGELSEKGDTPPVVEIEDSLTEEAQAFQERHGIRICRDCWVIVRRQQELRHPPAPPNWYKMHELFVDLQTEIDAALPAFQEQILSSSASLATLTPKQRSTLLASRKGILSRLASLDALGKRIKEYPSSREHAVGGAQDRLLRSIGNRSSLFLQERMGLLKGLGTFDDIPPAGDAKAHQRQKSNGGIVNLKAAQEMEARAEQLSVLLEQEKLVASYLEDANRRRQLTDSASLQQSLTDLRAEIARLKAES